MCGIFGIFIKSNTGFSETSFSPLLNHLALSSESRGKDSSGLAFIDTDSMHTELVKADVRLGDLIKTKEVSQLFSQAQKQYSKSGKDFSILGHARLVTNGSQLQAENNQPVVLEDDLLVHNGIIVNVNQLWQERPDWKRHYKIDSEYILKSLQEEFLLKGNSPQNILEGLEGTYSIMAFLASQQRLLMATNNGSLYFLHQPSKFLIVVSEAYYLKTLCQKSFGSAFSNIPITQLLPGESKYLDLETLDFVPFETKPKSDIRFRTNIKNIQGKENTREVIIEPEIHFNRNRETKLFELLEQNGDRIKNLKRCTRCVLPETFPFISFDKDGVCNYCNNYKKKEYPKNLDQLKEFVEPYRKSNGKPDCLVPFSGGRDSTYTLHVIKTELNLNPIAFTYDWGMVTDLARRNAARVCGKLGVENIIVAADIQSKRKNINQNITAWLKKPHLGMIPLFMAGDKYFFHYSNQILKQTGLQLSIWGSNPYENTDFKSGFAGIEPLFDKKRIDDIKFSNKLNLIRFFLNQYLSNTGYINSSIVDTVGSFYSRYMSKRHGYLQLFDYLKWNEQDVEDLIFKEYNWEKSIDSKSTWRIGDGTAAFYNYIYYTVAGFSEFDTFRSNQIRDGELTREQALKSVYEENFPRFENLSWYIEIIGLDFIKTIETINKIPKLYNAYL